MGLNLSEANSTLFLVLLNCLLNEAAARQNKNHTTLAICYFNRLSGEMLWISNNKNDTNCSTNIISITSSFKGCVLPPSMLTHEPLGELLNISIARLITSLTNNSKATFNNSSNPLMEDVIRCRLRDTYSRLLSFAAPYFIFIATYNNCLFIANRAKIQLISVIRDNSLNRFFEWEVCVVRNWIKFNYP